MVVVSVETKAVTVVKRVVVGVSVTKSVEVVLNVPVIALFVVNTVEVAVFVIVVVVGWGVFVMVEKTIVVAIAGFLLTVTVVLAVGTRATFFVPICVLQAWEVLVLGGFAATPLLRINSADSSVERMTFGMVELRDGPSCRRG